MYIYEDPKINLKNTVKTVQNYVPMEHPVSSESNIFCCSFGLYGSHPLEGWQSVTIFWVDGAMDGNHIQSHENILPHNVNLN